MKTIGKNSRTIRNNLLVFTCARSSSLLLRSINRAGQHSDGDVCGGEGGGSKRKKPSKPISDDTVALSAAGKHTAYIGAIERSVAIVFATTAGTEGAEKPTKHRSGGDVSITAFDPTIWHQRASRKRRTDGRTAIGTQDKRPVPIAERPRGDRGALDNIRRT